MTRSFQSILIGALLLGGCATAPDTRAEHDALVDSADAKLAEMVARDPTLQPLLEQSAGYIVFPSIGKGGALFGGAYGRGVVYVDGRPIGYASLSQASIGAQLGGASFSELMIFETREALQGLESSHYTGATQVNATVLTAGAAGSTGFQDGIATYVLGGEGLLIDASFAGQRIGYEPMLNPSQMGK